MIEKKPFTRYRLDEEVAEDKYKKIEIRMNENDIGKLAMFKKEIQQAKDGTAFKQALDLALAFVRDDHPNTTHKIILLGNRRRNMRIGLVDFD